MNGEPMARMLFVWVAPAVLAAAIVVPIAMAWASMPDPVAIHWGVGGEPDGSAPRGIGVWVPALGWFAAWVWLVTTGGRDPEAGLGPVGAVAYFIGGVLAAVSSAVVVANAGAAGWEDATLPGLWPPIATLGAASGAGVVGWVLGRRARSPGRATGERLEPVPAARPERGRTVFVERISNRSFVVASAGLALAFLVAPWFPGTWVVVTAGAVGAFASSVRVLVSEDGGVEVGFGPWGWPSRTIALDRIERAGVIDVEPIAYGGWGYRIRPAALSPSGGRSTTAVIIRRGRALGLDLTDGRRFVVTVDEADGAAALINRLVGVRSG